MRILILDDDKTFHELFRIKIKRFFENSEYDLVSIYTIEELINQLSNESFDFVFCDYMITIGRTRLIKEIFSRKPAHTKLIILTGLDKSEIDNLVLSRIDGYVSKGSVEKGLEEYLVK